jgi:hypothetical protein
MSKVKIALKKEEETRTSNQVTRYKTPAERLGALARAAAPIVVKFISGNWSVSDVPVPAGTRFMLHPSQVSHCWTRFQDGKVAEEISAIVSEDEDGDPELHIVKGQGRRDLGYDNQAEWEPDNIGKPRDPWNYGLGLPMTDIKTGAAVLFRTSSIGGMAAIAGQVANFARNPSLGYPIVELSTGSYKNKRYGGYTSYPIFQIVGYEPLPGDHGRNGGNGGQTAKVIGESKAAKNSDLNDEIPW